MIYLQDALELIAANNAMFISLLFFLGLVVGSFLNVVVYRLPIMMVNDWRGQAREILEIKAEEDGGRLSLSYPSSSCPGCKSIIRWYDNVPVLSYLILRGRCRKCNFTISPRYPLTELSVGVLTALTAYLFGPTLYMLSVVVVMWGVIAASSIDYSHQILPDIIVYPLLWLGLFMAYTGDAPITLNTAFLGVIAGYLPLWIIKSLYGAVRNVEGLGDGDLKLFAMFGAWLGYEDMLHLVLISVAVQLIVIVLLKLIGRNSPTQGSEYAFGPSISLAGLVFLLVTSFSI